MQNTTVTFHSDEHEKFFREHFKSLSLSAYDIERASLIYLLGINATTRSNFKKIYDTRLNEMNPDSFSMPFQTFSSRAITCLAFGVFTNSNPMEYSILDYFCGIDRDVVPYLFTGLAIRIGIVSINDFVGECCS